MSPKKEIKSKKNQKPEDSSAPKTSPSEEPTLSTPSTAGISPELIAMLDERIATVAKAEIETALEAFKPEVAAAVKGAMEQVIAVAQAQNPGVPIGAIPPIGGGVVPGSPVTPTGAEVLRMIFSQGQGAGMENLVQTLTQARAISDVLNPPTIWDRVMQNAVLRSLSKAGLVTESEMKELITQPASP